MKIKPYFESENITLFNCKYEDLLPGLKPGQFDLLLTDPPYATTNLAWDKNIDWNFFWSQSSRLCKPKSPMILFASGQFVYKLINTNSKNYRYELIWEKTAPVGFLSANHRPLRSHENILIFSQLYRACTYNPQMVEGKIHETGKCNRKAGHYGGQKGGHISRKTNLYHPRSVLKFKRDAKSLHPTQKPLELMQWLIRTYSNRFDSILEPFAGSGSTMVAAALEGRRVIGCEQSEEYCETIVQRLTQLPQKNNLLSLAVTA